MNALSQISNLEFKKVLTPTNIRVLRTIYFGLAAGAFAFGLVILIVYFQLPNKEYDEAMTPTLNILTILNVVFVITSIFLGKYLYDRQFNTIAPEIQKSSSFANNTVTNNFSIAEKCLATIRTASIIRLAQLEGSAFLGLVVTMLAVQRGAGNFQPMYFLNALSVLPLFIFIIATFPNADRLEEIFNDKFFNK
jgi:hypothetical protein